MLDRMTDAIDFHGKALQLRAQRQEVLSSNIANADTPGYKARDFKFADALQQADTSSAGRRPAAQGTSNPRHIPLHPVASGPQKPGYALQTEPALDNNSVDMDRERAAFMDNAVRYEATLRFINYQSRTLQSAITGQ